MAEEKTEPRKGKVVTLIKTSKGLFPWNALSQYETAAKKTKTQARNETRQLKEVEMFLMEKNLVPHPFNVTALLDLQENCTFFDACIRQIAEDVTGHGWDVTEKEDWEAEEDEEAEGGESGEEAGEQAPDRTYLAIKKLLDDPNTEDEMIDLDVLNRMIQDWGVMGWMCIEVSRDAASGEINGLYHVPAQTVWIHRDGKKYCQKRNNKYRWFKKFGVEEDIEQDSGEETGVTPENKAHEMIFIKNYYARSTYYGVPNVLAAAGAATILVGIRDYNLAFFENYGVPAAIVTLEGEWEEGSADKISNFIDVELKASQNAHKTIVLEMPEGGGKVVWTPLVVEVKEGHFKLYTVTVRNEVLSAYRMPAYRIGINESGALGGSNSPEATRIYIDSIVSPLKRRCEFIITRKIIMEGFENQRYEFTLGEVDLRDINAITNRCIGLFGIGVMTRTMVAKAVGETPPDPKKDPYADTYFISANYTPIGEESALTAMGTTDQAIQELKTKVEAVLLQGKPKEVPPTVVVDEELIEEG